MVGSQTINSYLLTAFVCLHAAHRVIHIYVVHASFVPVLGNGNRNENRKAKKRIRRAHKNEIINFNMFYALLNYACILFLVFLSVVIV